MTEISEQWKQIDMAPLFEVSNTGLVRNKDSHVLIEQIADDHNWPTVMLKGKGGYHLLRVSVLVCNAFNSRYREGLELQVINGRRADTRATNLRWVKKVSDGRGRPSDERVEETRHYNSRGSGRQIIRVRVVETGEEYESLAACAKAIGGSYQNVSACLRNSSKKLSGRKTYKGYTFEKVSPEQVIGGGHPGVRVRVVETGIIYQNLTECAEAIGGTHSGISEVLAGTQKSHRGYTFQRVDLP